MSTNRPHPFSRPSRRTLFSLGSAVLCVGLAWLLWPSTPPTAPNGARRPAPAAKTGTEQELSRAHDALENFRQAAARDQRRAAAESRNWAEGVVRAGQALAHASANAPAPAGPIVLPANEAPQVAVGRANIAQYQSRLLCGALELNDDQWRRVHRTLTAYYEEGYGRNLNAVARPPAGADAWLQQRESLSRHAFTAVEACLTAAQAAQFRRVYQADSWLWTADSPL